MRVNEKYVNQSTFCIERCFFCLAPGSLGHWKIFTEAKLNFILNSHLYSASPYEQLISVTKISMQRQVKLSCIIFEKEKRKIQSTFIFGFKTHSNCSCQANLTEIITHQYKRNWATRRPKSIAGLNGQPLMTCSSQRIIIRQLDWQYSCKQNMERRIGNYLIDLSRQVLLDSVSQTYIGLHLPTQQPRLVQLVPKSHFKSPFVLTDLSHAIISLRSLKSQHLSQPIDAFQTPVLLCVVTALAKCTLQSALAQQGVLSLTDSLLSMKQVGLATLALINQGFSLKNLSLKNLFLVQNKLLLKSFDVETQLNNQVFSIYSAPQTLAHGIYNYQSSVWSFGIIFYQLLFGIRSGFPSKEQLLKSQLCPISFPEGTNPIVAQFISGCLQPQPDRRLQWQDLFSHPIWEGFFFESIKTKNLAESKLKFLVRKLKDSIIKYNLNLEQLFFNLGLQADVPGPKFLQFLLMLDPTLNSFQAEYVFTKFDKDGSGSVSIQQVSAMLGSQIKLSSIKPFQQVREQDTLMQTEKADPMQLFRRSAGVIQSIKQFIVSKGVNGQQLFRMFSSGNGLRIAFEEYCKLLSLVNPTLTLEEQRASFSLFDWNKDGTIEFMQFAETVSRHSGLPLAML